MSHIPKHHAKLEGKGYDREETRIDLSITRNSVGVDNFLEDFSELIGLEVGGGRSTIFWEFREFYELARGKGGVLIANGV